jgi:hypothetical protein
VSGLEVLEKHLARDPSAGPLCHGYLPTIADCFLVPQVFNAQRHGIDIGAYPNIARINAACVGCRPSWRRIRRTSRTPSKRRRFHVRCLRAYPSRQGEADGVAGRQGARRAWRAMQREAHALVRRVSSDSGLLG